MAVMWWKKWSGIYVSNKTNMSMLFNTYFDRLYTDNE
jgi:hypothetical protein